MQPSVPQIPIALAALCLPLRRESVVVDANDAFLRLWGHAARDAVVGKPADATWLAPLCQRERDTRSCCV